MKPYGNLSSKNLSLLLNLARLTTILSLFIVVLAIGIIIYQFFGQTGFGINPWYTIGLAVLPTAMTVLLCSGLIVAIVAFEESYRKKTEAFISSVQK